MEWVSAAARRAYDLIVPKRTFLALMVEALRRSLAAEEMPRRPFKLPDRSFQGDGLMEGLSEADWARIRELSYEGRGP
jgi:hypothetical protein